MKDKIIWIAIALIIAIGLGFVGVMGILSTNEVLFSKIASIIVLILIEGAMTGGFILYLFD